jgi:heme-degrading monooxygenase HmoA
MHAAVVTMQGTAEQLDAIRQLYRERVLPALQAKPGFRQSFMLQDRSSGKGLGITLWESEQAARTAVEAMAEQRREGGQAMGQSDPLQGEFFEVVEQG